MWLSRPSVGPLGDPSQAKSNMAWRTPSDGQPRPVGREHHSEPTCQARRAPQRLTPQPHEGWFRAGQWLRWDDPCIMQARARPRSVTDYLPRPITRSKTVAVSALVIELDNRKVPSS